MAIAKTQITTKVWNFLINNGLTKAGAAGLMGNIQSESGVIPNRVEMLCLQRLRQNGQNYTDITYTAAVDSGAISRAKFLNPLPNKQYGYGLCQWTSPGRKGKFYDHMKSKVGRSIGDLEGQLEFLINQLKNSYPSVYKVLTTSGSVKECSDKVLKDFESPANWSSHSNTRSDYSWQYYNIFINEDTTEKQEPKKIEKLIDWSPYTGKISNSGHDERGSYSGGAAGDQNGEWEIRSWYNRPWNCVLRYPNIEIGQWIGLLGIEAANNNKIGYDQNQRDSYWQQLKNSGYRPSKITTACQSDCSAGVIANVRAVGYLKNIPALKNINATYTGNMRAGFKAAGFKVLTQAKYLQGTEYLLPGDILLNDAHHTATNLGIGKLSGGIDKPINDDIIPPTPSIKIEDADKYDKNIAGTYTTTDSLNLRSGAGTNKSLVLTIPKNKQVQNYGYYSIANDTKWYYVTYNGQKGFVSSKYLAGAGDKIPESNPKKDDSSAAAPSKTPKWVGKVTASLLNVRSGPGTNYNKIKSYPLLAKGNLIDVCDTVKDWYYIRIVGKYYGYVSSAYIQKV